MFRPALKLERLSPSSLRLTWPTSAPPFRLQSSTNLNGTNWESVLSPPVIAGSNAIVTNVITGSVKLFRLLTP
jgi:hypothetical protein